MAKKMLIDATHEEETRVAIVDGDRLVEFDYESTVRKQLKGSIFLAKVTRVEPSLQAAFVNYGGNRHGFLPFSEIHPDYFRIPVSDREALMAEQQAELEKLDAIIGDEDDEDIIDADIVEEDEDEDEEDAVVEVGGADKPADDEDADLVEKDTKGKKTKAKKSTKKATKKSAKKTAKKSSKKNVDSETEGESIGNKKPDDNEKSDEELDAEALAIASSMETPEESNSGNNKKNYRGRGRGRNNNKGRGRAPMRRKKSDEILDAEGGKPFRFNLRHKYKIQEVVKRGQIMLIQVSKEERGNKGAAVTSYMSLPGRYCVLMPNSPRGGGVSRKIGNFKDRKRMREILKELTIPDGMSVILRTAGVSRTKAEIKRDLDYLMRLWNTIREDTLKSSAPAQINEEGNLIKRSIRDLYTRDINEVFVSGSKGYKTAKNFMKMLVPSHAKKVTEYIDDKVPLFHRYHVEKQISDIGEISVTLKSGGYLVINPTEALVSIDVNSGKATKERHIEGTALKTNLEAAEEVSRQLRLRDLGGLVVIDFIDMEERRNNRKVENKLRDALSEDRARIQVGRISSFGLLELSRQRLNPSLTEAQFNTCPHCEGSGTVKTLDFAAITAIRALEEEGIKGVVSELSLNVPNDVAVYMLNHKRQMLADIEARYDFRVHVRIDKDLKPSEFRLDAIAQHEGKQNQEPAQKQQKQNNQRNDHEDGDGQQKPKRSRRRGRRGGRRHNKNQDNDQNNDQGNNQTSGQNNQSQQSGNESDVKEKNNQPNENAGKTKNDPAQSKEMDKKPSKKSTKKAAKKSAKKTEEKSPSKEPQQEPSNSQKPSNDSAPLTSSAPSEYEVVNEAPKKKKKGWWNRLVD